MTTAGIIFFWTGILWLIFLSVREENSLIVKILWATANFFLNPIAGATFYVIYKKGLIPAVLCVIGLILIYFGSFDSFTPIP